MKLLIIPSIIARSQQELESRLKKISLINPELVQLDVMDGEFVKHASLEFDFKLPKSMKYEAHLMINRPEAWLMHNHSKINSVIFHYESEAHIHELIKLARKNKKKVGIAINPETDAEDIVQYLKIVDKVLVMTVSPGKYGSNFLPEMIDKIRYIRKLNGKIEIEVDGGINEKTIKSCFKAGANGFVVGSYFQKATNIKQALADLKKAIIN